MTDWRPAHIGFANDGVVIDGVDVWKQQWRPAVDPPVALPHPAHPHQIHAYGIHEVGDAGSPVRFAACELSNGVWGFYVPPDAVVASPGIRLEGTQVTRHVSPDGAIRVDLAAVEWSNTHWVQSPRVVDVAGDRVVLDLWNSDWDAAVTFPAPGRVRLGFRRYRHAGTLVAEIDMARGACRIVVGPGQQALPETSLDHLAAALEEASRRAEALEARDPDERPSPNSARHPLAAWRTALVIFILALLAIAAIASWATHQRPDAKRILDTVPAMPK